MSDLISRKAVIDIINKHRCDTNRIEENVLNLPTAYDVDKVVKQLEEKCKPESTDKIDAKDLYSYQSGIIDAISIVKGAVKDE
jgi:hypothetical protein